MDQNVLIVNISMLLISYANLVQIIANYVQDQLSVLNVMLDMKLKMESAKLL